MRSTVILAFALFVCALALPHGGLQPRIHGGYPATANQFPHQVSLVIIGTSGRNVCGGSLISPLWVLSASHCVISTSQVNLRFGSTNLAGGGIAMVSNRIITHPNFHPVTLNNDVAVIGLPSAVTLTPAIQVIRLPRRAQSGITFAGVQGTISGWGAINSINSSVVTDLRWVNVRVITNEECMRSYFNGLVVNHVVCTIGLVTPSQGTCGGDSGGPLIISEAGVNTQIGVVAFGNHPDRGGCSTDHPSGYMRTTHFLDWIRLHTGIPVRD